MDDPRDVNTGEDQNEKLMAGKDGKGTIEMSNLPPGATETDVQPEEITSGPESPLIRDEKAKFKYNELDDNGNGDGINEEAICNLLKENSDQLLPMFKDTLILTKRLVQAM